MGIRRLRRSWHESFRRVEEARLSRSAAAPQRARVVILCAFVFEHVRLLLFSKTDNGRFSKGLANSSGYVGRNILAHGDVRAMGLFDHFIINGFIGPGSAAMRFDDFNGNNFDHTGLGFIRGGTIGTSGDGTPVTRIDVLPLGTPSWGKELKEHRMGANPKNSIVNDFCQTHDVPNLFVVGSSVFRTMSGYPATATIAALSYRRRNTSCGRNSGLPSGAEKVS
jgi:choline dehydrogenase-like flavoprotein